MKTKAEKQFEEQKKIATLIVDIKQSAEDMALLSQSLLQQAAAAARMGEDEYAEELIEFSLDLDQTIADLNFTIITIQTMTLTSAVFAKLSKIPTIVKSCVGMLKSGPNFAKSAEQLRSLREMQRKSLDQLRQFRVGLSRGNRKASDIVTPKTASAERERRKAEKRKQLEAILMQDGITAAPVAAPAEATVTAGDDARIDAIARMLDDARRG